MKNAKGKSYVNKLSQNVYIQISNVNKIRGGRAPHPSPSLRSGEGSSPRGASRLLVVVRKWGEYPPPLPPSLLRRGRVPPPRDYFHGQWVMSAPENGCARPAPLRFFGADENRKTLKEGLFIGVRQSADTLFVPLWSTGSSPVGGLPVASRRVITRVQTARASALLAMARRRIQSEEPIGGEEFLPPRAVAPPARASHQIFSRDYCFLCASRGGAGAFQYIARIADTPPTSHPPTPRPRWRGDCHTLRLSTFFFDILRPKNL